MRFITPGKKEPPAGAPAVSAKRQIFSRAVNWEVPVIALVAGFLRLYRLDTSEFDGDQAAIFGMAREAVRHGLLPIVSNRASIGIENPPAVIDFLMFPAALSANPLLAVVMVGLLNTAAVLLTYFFTRRYFGRCAGISAALLYAAAAKPLNYSRFIWQQNMLAPFVVLFMFALCMGVVERRRGWFVPAVLLLGVSYQLHETAALLIFPLLTAVLLAPATLRWRDLALASGGLLILFAPYALWEFTTHFADVTIVLNATRLRAHIDTTAINSYTFLLSPNGFAFNYRLPASPASILHQVGFILNPLRYTLILLLAAGLALVGIAALWAQPPGAHVTQAASAEIHRRPPMKRKTPLSALINWGGDLRANPYRCGLLLVFTWQVVPLLFLSRHSLPLYVYYLLILMPGPFILMGLLIEQLLSWTRQRSWYLRGAHAGIYIIAFLTITAQLVAGTATILDATRGVNGHGKAFNDLGSLQGALSEADRLAETHHLKRVYVTIDSASQTAISYLAQQMQTPTTLFDDSHCLVLPNPADGPAVLLVSPYAQLTLTLLRIYASLQLVGRSPRLGAPPFRLYIVSTAPLTRLAHASASFVNDLQYDDMQRLPASPSWLATRWTLLRSLPAASRTIYNYQLTAAAETSLCAFTAIHAGNELIVAFMPLHATHLTLKGQMYTEIPYHPSFGPLRFETDLTLYTPRVILRTARGKDGIALPSS
jgi:hypothetical protein